MAGENDCSDGLDFGPPEVRLPQTGRGRRTVLELVRDWLIVLTLVAFWVYQVMVQVTHLIGRHGRP